MIVYTLAILLIGAALSFGLSRLLPTRPLGVAAALVCWAALIPCLMPGPAEAAEAAPVVSDLLTLGAAAFSVTPLLPLAERGLAVVLLLGCGAALLALAGAVAGGVRGFGGLFGWALIAVAAALLSLAAPPLSLLNPLAWALIAVAGYGALRASGAVEGAERPPPGLSFGLLGSALLAAMIAGVTATTGSGELIVPWPALAAGVLGALALAGCPPLLLAREEAVGGPAPLGALVFGLCGPIAAVGWLLRMLAALPVPPLGLGVALGLVGGMGALACSVGALGERRLRPILAWVSGGQVSLAVAAAGMAGPLAALAGPALLSGAALTAVLGAAAAVSFERATGSDDYTHPGPAPRAAALIWAASALASLGLPPLWSFWGRFWLLEATLEQHPWLIPPILIGLALLALALLIPLAGMWAAARGEGARSSWADWLPGAVALLALLVAGVAPGLAWDGWLQAVPFAPPAPPFDPAGQGLALVAGLLLLALCGLLAALGPSRELAREPDEEPIRLAPEALGATLRPLAWLAGPRPLIRGLWTLLERASGGLRVLMGLFEQRYYLLGVLAALITIMLLMAQ